MSATVKIRMIYPAVLFVISLIAAGAAWANGGPFVVKYPEGDPAAKGIFARLDPDLKPAREERLRVIKEDLEITFGVDGLSLGDRNATLPPLAFVSAAYTIENPTDQEIDVDFGFPILRGIYVHPLSMQPRPDVQVRLNDADIQVDVISNSAIYGLIRQRSRELIEAAIARDPRLANLVANVRARGMVRERARRAIREAAGTDAALSAAVVNDVLLNAIAAPIPATGEPGLDAARAALADHLRNAMKWSDTDVALMVEFASLDFGTMRTHPPDRGFIYWGFASQFTNENLGPLAAIGEQKATQLFANLAACFDPTVASTYESIFTAWGGDVRERSVDLETGAVRPREISVLPKDPAADGGVNAWLAGSDPTIYARVDYLDPNASITEAEKASCATTLKNLPVIFTFAPMNLLHYRVQFLPKTTQTLTVSYRQYAYRDTRAPESCQLAYVVHPASLWKDFGPIHLEVAVPEHVPFRASVPCESAGAEDRDLASLTGFPPPSDQPQKRRFTIHRATLTEKTGELFLAVDAGAWKNGQAERTAASSDQPHGG